jgi:hypothetical protein
MHTRYDHMTDEEFLSFLKASDVYYQEQRGSDSPEVLTSVVKRMESLLDQLATHRQLYNALIQVDVTKKPGKHYLQ